MQGFRDQVIEAKKNIAEGAYPNFRLTLSI